MRPLRTGALALLGALAISMMGSTALAQRFVPMRYDLRSRQARYGGNPYTTYRNYNPYAAPYRGYAGYGGYYSAYGSAAQSDPYSFEALQQRNYFVTGNVRAGKSFQGTVPYQDSGSRLSSDLPSLRLSDFRRDSVGIEDIGTGVEYGLPLPYIPSSAAVTTPGMVDRRFAPAEAYIPPTVGPYGYGMVIPLPQAYGQGGDDVALWSPGVFLGEEGGVAAVPDGLPLPQGFWDMLEAYTEGGEETEPAFSLAQGAEGEEPEPSDAYGLRGTLPQNIYDPHRDMGEAGEEAPAFGGSALYWLKDETASAAETGETEMSAEIAPQYMDTGAIVPPPAGGLQQIPQSRYAEQVRRAHEAMKAGRFAEAERIYGDALARDPGRPAAAFGRAHALLGLAYYHQASLVLVRYLRVHPAWAADLPDLKSVYVDAQMYERTVSDLERSAKGEGATPAHRFLLGYVLCAGGRRDEARPYLEQAAASAEMKEAAQALLDAIAAASPQPGPR